MAFLVSAVIVFACGMVYNNRVYRHGLYGNRAVVTSSNGFTTIGDHFDDSNNDNNDNNDSGNNNKRQATDVLESLSESVGTFSGSVVSEISQTESVLSTFELISESISEPTNTAEGISGFDVEDENEFGNNLGAFTYGTMPWGGSDTEVLGAGIPVLYSTSGINPSNANVDSGNNNKRQTTDNGLTNAFFFPTPYTGAFNGTLGYKWGAHAGWYLTIVALALIPLALLLGLTIKTKDTVVTKTRNVERVVTSQAAVVPQHAQGPAVLPPQPFAPVANRSL
jgi:hypothetical protein